MGLCRSRGWTKDSAGEPTSHYVFSKKTRAAQAPRLQKNQIWEQFVSDNIRNEVDLLKSRTNIAETLLTEKTKQLDLVQKQVDMLKQHLLSADQLNKEQAIMIESLKRRLNGGRRENGNGTSNNGKFNMYKKIWW